jgi:predicted regulator of Ras-like GTPase activity (Roadblock/LC7/MglB family)
MLAGLGQLIYTSFPGTGLTKLFSDQVPPEIQDIFLHQIVYENWNSYKPPSSSDQAIYLHQPNLESCIFGWLYSDGVDEHNRHIPYFIGYFLAQPLTLEYLQQILTCLQKGPVTYWDHNSSSDQSPDLINIEDIDTYEPVRKGLLIPPKILSDSYTFLGEKNPLNFFVFAEKNIPDRTLISNDNYNQSSSKDIESPYLKEVDDIVNTADEINRILQDFINKPLEVQCAFLVSLEGQLLTPAVNMDENSALIVAGTMIYLAQSTSEELQWETIDKISIQGKEGYVILASCTPNVFLLIQAGKGLIGLLDGEINRIIQKIQAIFLRGESNIDPFIKDPNIQESSVSKSDVDSMKASNTLHREDPDGRLS